VFYLQCHNEKSAQRRRKHCMLAVVRRSQIFMPRRRPHAGGADFLPGVPARDGQSLISWRWSLPLPTDQVWWTSMHAFLSYHGNRPTNTHTHLPQNRQDWLQYTVPQLAHGVNIELKAKQHGWHGSKNVDLTCL